MSILNYSRLCIGFGIISLLCRGILFCNSTVGVELFDLHAMVLYLTYTLKDAIAMHIKILNPIYNCRADEMVLLFSILFDVIVEGGIRE